MTETKHGIHKKKSDNILVLFSAKFVFQNTLSPVSSWRDKFSSNSLIFVFICLYILGIWIVLATQQYVYLPEIFPPHLIAPVRAIFLYILSPSKLREHANVFLKAGIKKPPITLFYTSSKYFLCPYSQY